MKQYLKVLLLSHLILSNLNHICLYSTTSFFLLFWRVLIIVVAQGLSYVWLCTPKDCSMPHFPDLHRLPEFAQIHVHCVGDAIQPSHPLLPLLLLPSIFPSIRVFSSELAFHIRWMNIKGWFSLGFTGLVSLHFMGLSRVFPQHHISKASILLCSAFFMVQRSLLEKPQLWLYWSLSVKWCLYFLIH